MTDSLCLCPLQAAWIMMPSKEGAEHGAYNTRTTAASDQHGRKGLETLHEEPDGTEDAETSANNPGIKEDSGTRFDDLKGNEHDPESGTPPNQNGQGNRDEDGNEPSEKDIKESLNRAAVSYKWLFSCSKGEIGSKC